MEVLNTACLYGKWPSADDQLPSITIFGSVERIPVAENDYIHDE